MLLFNIVMISYPIYRAFTIINMRKADGTCSVFRYLFILFCPFDTPVLKSCIQRFINVICILCFPVRYQCWKGNTWNILFIRNLNPMYQYQIRLVLLIFSLIKCHLENKIPHLFCQDFRALCGFQHHIIQVLKMNIDALPGIRL